MNETLLTALWKRQDDEGWSDRQLADELGINHSTLSLIRHGQRGVGAKVISRIITRFPEYTHLALFFLQQDASDTSTGVDGGKVAA